MSAVGGQEIIILFVIIGILLFAFQKRPQAKKRDTLYAFEFSSNQPFEEISNRATLRNPLNLVFIVMIVNGLFYMTLPLILELLGLAGDYTFQNWIYIIGGVVFSLVFIVISFSIPNKVLRYISIAYFVYQIYYSLSEFLPNIY